MSRLISFIACCGEEVFAFLAGIEVADGASGLPDFVIGSGGGLADQGLEFRERHFDGVEVGAVGRQEEEPCTERFECLGGCGAFVAGEVIEDHHIPRLQRRRQLGFDVEIEALAVDRALDHPRGGEPVMTQPGDEGLRMPVPERRVIEQPLAPRRPSCGLDKLGVKRGFVDEDQPFQGPTHEGLAPRDPDLACAGDIGPPLLCGVQGFFYD